MSSATVPEASPDLALENALALDARAVHDAASVHFDDYEPDGRPSWILAAVAPGPNSGSLTVAGGYIDSRTGKSVDPPGAKWSIIKKGTWKLIASSPPINTCGEGYSWFAPKGSSLILDRISPEEFYSPFESGGAILFQPVAGKADGEQFGAVRVIFPDWEVSVAPAFAFHEANPHLLDPDPRPSSVFKLMDLAANPNPFLAVVAFRNLLGHGLVTGEWVQARTSAVGGHLAAVFCYLTLITTGRNDSTPFANETLPVIDAAGEPTVRGLIVGAYAAAKFAAVNDGGTRQRAGAVLVNSRQRLRAMGVDIEKDALLARVFRGLPD